MDELSPYPTASCDGELREEDFASPECLEDIKAYSSLLQQCDAILPQGPDAVLSVTSKAAKRTHRDAFSGMQNKVNMLVRNHEVLAITHTDAAGSKQGQIVVINSENVIHGIKAAKDAHLKEKVHPLKVYVQQAHVSNFGQSTLSTDVEPVDHLLNRYGEIAASHSGNSATPDVSLAEHIDIVKGLLIACHNSTTGALLEAARERLRDYIILSSHRKMYRRLEMGQKTRGRDFYDILTLSTKLPQFDANDIADHEVLRRHPTAAQLAQFKRFADSAGSPSWTDGKADLPIYTKKNRKMLQKMLRVYLRKTQQALMALKNSIRLDKLAKASREAVEIKSLVAAAHLEVQNLNYFVMAFEPVLVEHFKWLEQFRRNGATKFTDVASLDAEMSVFNDPTIGTGHPTQRSPSDLSKASVGDNDDVEMGGIDLDSDDDDNDEGSEMEMLEDIKQLAKMEGSEKGWAIGAMRYLKLICLHEFAILCATNLKPPGQNQSAAQQREYRLLTESCFTVVDIQQDKLDLQRKAFTQCMDEIVQRKTGLDKAGILKFLARQRKNGKLEEANWIVISTAFSGTFHCETILLVLAVLATKPEISSELTQDWLNRNGIFAAKSDLNNMFRSMLPHVSISKQDCPVCNKVYQLVAESKALQGSKRLLTPGHHTPTSAVALPPFTPREIAESCLQDIMKKVDDRMEKIQWAVEVSKELSSYSPIGVGSYPGIDRETLARVQSPPAWSEDEDSSPWDSGDDEPAPVTPARFAGSSLVKSRKVEAD